MVPNAPTVVVPVHIDFSTGYGAEFRREFGASVHIANTLMKPRIMYIERKAGSLTGPARIGRVRFNRTGRTLFYGDHVFRRVVGGGFKSNYIDETTGEDYWISGPKRQGGDRMYGSAAPIEIDDDVREEYWCCIRN